MASIQIYNETTPNDDRRDLWSYPAKNSECYYIPLNDVCSNTCTSTPPTSFDNESCSCYSLTSEVSRTSYFSNSLRVQQAAVGWTITRANDDPGDIYNVDANEVDFFPTFPEKSERYFLDTVDVPVAEAADQAERRRTAVTKGDNPELTYTARKIARKSEIEAKQVHLGIEHALNPTYDGEAMGFRPISQDCNTSGPEKDDISIFLSKKETDDDSATFITAGEETLGTKSTGPAAYSRVVSPMTIGSNETFMTAGENTLGSKYADRTDYSDVNSPMIIGSNIEWEGTQRNLPVNINNELENFQAQQQEQHTTAAKNETSKTMVPLPLTPDYIVSVPCQYLDPPRRNISSLSLLSLQVNFPSDENCVKGNTDDVDEENSDKNSSDGLFQDFDILYSVLSDNSEYKELRAVHRHICEALHISCQEQPPKQHIHRHIYNSEEKKGSDSSIDYSDDGYEDSGYASSCRRDHRKTI